MLAAMRSAVRRGLKLSCFIVIGFPDDTPATLRATLSLIRRMAVLGVYDIAVSKFVPIRARRSSAGCSRRAS